MSEPVVIVERSTRVWRVTLNRPASGNACSPDLVRALEDAFADAEAHRVHGVMLLGSGKHFCTGFDLSTLPQETDDSLLARFVRIELLLQRVYRAPFLTIAVAHGRTVGAGADLFAACQLRMIRRDAKFAFPGYSGFGIVLGTRRLTGCVGAHNAGRWVHDGRAIEMSEALASGLISGVIDDVPAHDRFDGLSACPHDTSDEISHARDLELLVRSAAAPGLRDRIGAYAARVAASRALPISSKD